MENCTWYKVPVSGSISRPYACPSLLHSAFFKMDWQAGTEWSWELTAYPFTGKRPSRGMKSSQGRAAQPSNSSSKERAGKQPRHSSTRAPQRRFRFSRGISAGPPWHSTRPFSARTSDSPSFFSS